MKNRLFLVSSLLLLSLSHGTSADEPDPELIPVRWRGGDANWSMPFRWIPSTTAPNNTAIENYSVTIDSGSVVVDIPVEVSELFLNNQWLDLQQPLSTGTLVVNGAAVFGDAGLRVSGDLVLKRGSVGRTGTGPGSFDVSGDVVKRGFGIAWLTAFEDGGNYEILVDQGTLRPGNGGPGTREPGITVTSPEFARILTDGLRLTDDIFLNNGMGYANRGALYNPSGLDGGIEGEIHLGDRGATIGSGDDLRIFGGIHGGSLNVVGNRGAVVLRSDTHTYTGRTSVGENGEGAFFVLEDRGAVHSTSEIVLGGNATLFLNNHRGASSDRLPNEAPIRSHGGVLQVLHDSNTPVAEKIGHLNLIQGSTRLVSGRNSTNWVFDGMTRSEFATIEFGLRARGSDDSPIIASDAALPLTNSILGGWATTSDGDWATYDGRLGILALGDRIARPSEIEGAGVNDHVRVNIGDPQALAADRDIATLVVRREGSNTNLGGHTLTIQQGGLVVRGSTNFSTSISQGRLTTGDNADSSVLYLHGWGGQTGRGLADIDIRASIVDNRFGGEVSLVKSGPGEVTLSAENTYSGATVVQPGRLTFATQNSLPSGGVFWVDGGTAILNYTANGPKRLSSFTLSQGGTVQIGRDGVNVEIDADQFTLESGTVSAPFAGTGILRKTTPGLVSLEVESTNFLGEVIIEEGLLLAGGESVRATPKALGKGRTTILPGGTLVHGSVLSGAGYMLLDADLDLAGGDVGLAVSIRTPRWDFNGDWSITAPSRFLMFDFSGRDNVSVPTGERATPIVNVLQRVAISDSAGLTILGEGEFNFAAGVVVSGNTFVNVGDDGVALLNAFSAHTEGAKLELQGMGVAALPSLLTNEGSGSLTIEVTSGATAGFSLRSTTIDEGVTLALNGHTTGRPFFVLDGGTLSGSRIHGIVNNRSGILSPGDGIGEVHLERIQQDSDGVLSVELLGGATPASDVIHARDATLSGLISLTLVDGSQVYPGDQFDLVIADTLSIQGLALATDGFLGRLELVTPDAGARTEKTVLRLTVVPEPGATLLLFPCLLIAYRSRVCRRDQFV